MKSARRLPAFVAWGLIVPFTVAALGAVLQEATPETTPPPTPIEQALMEHVCSVVPLAAPRKAIDISPASGRSC